MPEPVHLLLVEDDDAIAEPLVTALNHAGFKVTRVATGAAALAADTPDLVLLDLGLPDIDGFEVCRELRTRGELPIIVVSARGDEVDRVIGLELGADDYLVKPFGVRELLARIKAVTRRTSRGTPPATAGDLLRSGPLVVDRRTRRATIAEEELILTRKEFDLLALLMTDPGATQTREQIMEQVWDVNWFGSSKTLDVHIASVRRKLGDPTLIETVRGVGFRMRDTM